MTVAGEEEIFSREKERASSTVGPWRGMQGEAEFDPCQVISPRHAFPQI